MVEEEKRAFFFGQIKPVARVRIAIGWRLTVGWRPTAVCDPQPCLYKKINKKVLEELFMLH